MDSITQKRIALTHPKLRDTFTAFVSECNNAFGINLRVTQGLRTFGEQDALYAQGRTTPEKIVTNAKGGQSYHNYGLAIDLAVLTDSGIDWSFDMSRLVPIATKYNLEWGGTFPVPDHPHFENRFGYTWEQLLTMEKDSEGYVVL